MKKSVWLLAACILLVFSVLTISSEPKNDKAVYRKKHQDATLKQISDEQKKAESEKEKVTNEIIKKNKDIEKAKKEKEKTLRFDLSKIEKPVKVEQFKSFFHFPPIPQLMTNTCWCFSQTSFYESEIYRMYGEKIKLSEMYTVYYEYIDKIKRYIKERGYSYFAEGSEGNALDRVWKQYGIVPAEAYVGMIPPDALLNHDPLIRDLKNLLDWVKENSYWDEEIVIDLAKVILNKYMGKPPQEFAYKGKTYTPMTFFKDVVRLNMDDYVQFQSTLALPFYIKGIFDVPDNWWLSADYYNVPIDDFMNIINGAISKGFTIAIGGDVSESGYNGWEKACVVPTFDIPGDYIDQNARELRIFNSTTEDDHGIHLVGYTKIGGHNWYLIKDSARSARQTKPEGYQFYRDDYVKLKMLTFSVHKDAVKDYLSKIEKKAPEKKEIELMPDGPFSKK
jgi:bleomycin hydrolase